MAPLGEPAENNQQIEKGKALKAAFFIVALSVPALLQAQQSDFSAQTYSAETSIKQCQARKQKYLACYESEYKLASAGLDLAVANVQLFVNASLSTGAAVKAIETNIQQLQALNRAYVPLLRDELKKNPAALALLPKLHAAFDGSISGKPLDPRESKAVFAQRIAAERAEVTSLLKQIEFSQ